MVRKQTELPAEYVTLLLNQRSSQHKAFHLMSADGCAAYSYGSEDIFVFGKTRADWVFHGFRSDAHFLMARELGGELEVLFAVGASFIEWNGQPIFRAEKSCSWLQWHKVEGATASDPMLLKFFDTTVLRARSAVPLKQ